LVADNDIEFTFAIQKIMKNDCVDVNCTQFVEKAFDILMTSEYCLVALSLRPNVSRDMTLLRMMRESKSIPIMAFTQKLSLSEKIALFHAGANVCLEKPIDATLCAAQACSLIQLYLNAREDSRERHPLIFGTELIINPIYRYVIIDSQPLELTRTEFDLLFYMASHPNQIFTRQQLYQQIWGDDLGINGENTVRSHIGNLYKKLADTGKKLHSKFQRGRLQICSSCW